MKSDNIQNIAEESSLLTDSPSSEILAQWLKRSLDKTFGSLVDESIARLGSTDITSTNASGNIFRNISGSTEMFAFRSDMEQSIEIALSNVMEKEMHHTSSRTPHFNSSGLIKPSFSRITYLQNILKTPLSEVVSSPTWRDLQKVLCDELSHEDSRAFTLVLQIHTRLLTSASPVAVKEGFLNLLEGLSLHYLSHQIFPELPNVSQGIRFSNHAHYRIVQISQIILTALCDAPKRWIRFGEKHFEEMVDNFVDMLNMHTYNHVPRKESKHIFFPYHIISTIDPEASWCKNLMHAAYGREITLGSFLKASSLMRSVVEDTVSWLDQHIHENKDLPEVHDLDSKGIVQGNVIKFATFTHSLSVIALIVSYENGWKNFPIQTHIRDEPVTLQEIVVLCLQFLNKAPDVEIPLKLSEILINAVVQIMISKGSSILLSANHELSQTLLQPISSSHQFQIEPCTSTVKILRKIAEFPNGFNWLLKRPDSSRRARISTHSSISSMNEGHITSTQRSSRKNSVRSVSPYTYSTSIAQIVSDFAAFVLKNEDTFMSDNMYEKFTTNVLKLCCKLFGQHDGINVLDTSKSKLLQYSVIAYQNINHKMKNILPQNETDQFAFNHQDKHRNLHQFLLKVASTPIGFRQLVLQTGVVENLIQDAINTSNPLDPTDLWSNTALCRILQFEDTTHGDTISLRRKLLSKALNNVYTAFENEEALMTGSDQLQNKAVNEFKMKLLLICSSVTVLHNLFEEHEDSSTESTLIDGDPPRTLPQLLNLALSECDSLNCLPHWIGLLSLHTLTLNMNFMLFLEARLSYQDTLANLQSKRLDEDDQTPSSPNPDLMSIVWDDCSSLRHQILKAAFKANNGSNKILRISSAVSSPLSPQPLSWPGRRMQTELQRFLHDTRPGLHDTTWLGHARRAYRLSAHADIKISVLLDLVDQVQRCQPLPDRPSRTFIWPKSDSNPVSEYDLQDKLGAELSLKFGFDQRLIQNTGQQTREQLLLLLNQTNSFLQISDPLVQFDWFVSSVFLLSGGNIERSRSLLQRLAPIPSTAFLWSNLSSALCHEDWTATFGHQLETIVAAHFPHAHHALQLAGVSWWWLSNRLVQQGLWSVLNIQQIAHAIVLCILHSSDFQLLLRVALLAHLQPRLLQAVAQSTNVITALQKSTQMDFRICDYLPLMDRLAKYCRFSTTREQTL